MSKPIRLIAVLLICAVLLPAQAAPFSVRPQPRWLLRQA